jgi:hypothetical protein
MPHGERACVTAFAKTSSWHGEAFLHPATARVVALREESQGLYNLMFELHSNLLMGDRGKAVLALTAAFFIALWMTGLALWWPLRWRKAFQLRLRGRGLLALAEAHLRLSRLRAWAAIARHQAARREEAAARASPAEAALAAMAEVLAAAHVAAGLGLDTSAPSTAPVTPAPATVPATPAPSTPAAAAPFSAGISPAFYPASGAFSDAPTFEASAFGEASFGQATPTFDEGPAFDDAAPCGEAFAFGQASAFGEPPAFDESAAFGQAFFQYIDYFNRMRSYL